MRHLLAVLLSIATIYCAEAQKPSAGSNPYAATDKTALALHADKVRSTQDIADYVNAHFNSEKDKARAIFIWTASNIDYDVKNMFALNFYETQQEKISKALATHMGICENYAAIFTDAAQKCGLQAYTVTGYTKQNGYTDYVPHAWCAARIDGTWYLFDPTWGAGYISNKTFTRKINNDYFLAGADAMLKSHMPFDPMWELMYYPITNEDFSIGKTLDDRSQPYFSYVDSIAVYSMQSNDERMAAEVRRLEANVVNNSLIYDRLKHLKSTLEVNQQNQTVGEYNFAVADYNDAVNLFNQYINYYNTQFKPAKSDADTKQMIDTVNVKMNMARTRLGQIRHADAATLSLIKSLQTSMDGLQPHVDEQEEFMAKYLAKGKMGRKMAFRKITWMGVPLN